MSRAAEELHVTQPTLSRQIADLEHNQDVRYCFVIAADVEPTEEGLYC